MSSALLLNASWEPLCIVAARRALVLILDGKAELVEAGDVVFRSQRSVHQAPLVVRLVRYVKVPYRKRVQLNLTNLLKRDGGKCAYCGGRAESMDHVIPRSRGGRHEWTNVVAACRRCNGKKDNHTLEELGWSLPFKPFVPKDRRWLVVGVGRVDPAWENYLTPAAA